MKERFTSRNTRIGRVLEHSWEKGQNPYVARVITEEERLERARELGREAAREAAKKADENEKKA